MTTAERRARILQAAADQLQTVGIAATSRRSVAREAVVATRSVTSMAATRTDLLREVVAALPFPPTSQRMQAQASDSETSAMGTLLTVARDAFGAPASVWDVRELQGVVLAPFDEELADVVRARVAMRWEAAQAVIRQLRGAGAIDETIDDDAATLHLLAVGAGIALLEWLVPRQAEAKAWLGLVARHLESLAAVDPPGPADDGPRYPWRVRVETPDSPSATSRVLRVLALVGADVTTMFTHAQDDGTQLIDCFVQVPASVPSTTLADILGSVSRRVVVAHGTPQDETDVVSRLLDAAAVLVEHPEEAPRAAAELVLADSWQVEPAATGADSGPDVMRLQWTPDHHVILRRKGFPFVDIERTRASALLRLVDALSRAPAGSGGFGWVEYLRDGTRVSIRLARPEDADGVADMHERSSEATRYQRYFAPVTEWRDDRLRRVAGGHRGATLVAEDARGHIVGLGNVFPERPDETAVAEIAAIVEDDWQGRGLGLRLLVHLVDLARRLGFTSIVALVLAENTGMIKLLERLGLEWTREADPDLGSRVVRMVAAL